MIELDQPVLLKLNAQRLIFIDCEFYIVFHFSLMQADGSRYTNGNDHGAVKMDGKGMEAKNSGFSGEMVSARFNWCIFNEIIAQFAQGLIN